MLSKLKIALVTTCLVGSVAGIAAASPTGGSLDRKAMRETHKAEMLAKYDTNKNGVLDPAERQVMKDEHAAKMFKELDKDGDGKLSLVEFKAAKSFDHHRGGRGEKGRERGEDRDDDRGTPAK